MTHRSRLAPSVLALAITSALSTAAPAATPILVTTGADSGEGSLRAALAEAARDGAPRHVLVATDDDIEIASSLVYAGTQPLTIHGDGQTVSTAENVTLLAASEGADLTVSNLTFAGPGGFDIENRGDIDGPGGKGIFVDVRDDQQGLVTLTLTGVTVRGVANHGIHVSDCSLADEFGGGSGGAGDGSQASIHLNLTDVTVDGAGTGRFDADGVRVDERAAGGITLISSGSTFTNVGADGVELDEGQDGTVVAISRGDSFIDNGDYCDPALLEAFMPAEPEGEFEDGEMAEDMIPGDVTGTPDDRCFEREVETYDSGSVAEYEIGIDVDDAFDIDEAGRGDLESVFIGGRIEGNFDEGMDYDEEGAGSIVVSIWKSGASGNSDDGYKFSAADDGGVEALVGDSTASGNGGVGAVFEEEDAGDVTVTIIGTATEGNDDGELGVEVVQEDEGTGTLAVSDSDIADGIEAEGVTVSEM